MGIHHRAVPAPTMAETEGGAGNEAEHHWGSRMARKEHTLCISQPYSNREALSKFLSFSVPQFPHLKSGLGSSQVVRWLRIHFAM